ncbi:hypothetical protein SOVF_172520 [Spinacia oleracea]|uniref:Probable WRKY transcription factor 75 n=1 Tax=Spinacia oleracea TaxID=3562 RepID=A0A9R0IAX1_SPIOL|nr:probable WRKY transcription factor 75 [Spinacia oleracea]KNA07371.1 hypothetical protein SOVF_172520 [Spinacia oleracea]
MEAYSIFSSSTNSSTSSPTNNSNFPFSLSQVSSSSNSFDHNKMDQSYHHLSQRIPPPMVVVQAHELMSNHNYHDIITPLNNHHQDNDDDQKKRIIMDNDDNSNSNSASNKKGSLEKKAKKHRFAFQTRSQVDILDDGYRWRKYGQKAVKNNKFPRSYYRCTYQGCNVKKQVQRLSNDEGVVVTTYDGIHSHSIERSTDNFEHILTQMQIYNSF